MSCGCPDKYTYNESSGVCEHLERTQAELNPAPVLPPSLETDPAFMRWGTLVFPPIATDKFPITLTSFVNPEYKDVNNTVILPVDTLISGNMWVSNHSIGGGRFNQAGIGLLAPGSQWQGYVKCLTVEEGDQISVAIGATRGFRILINGVLAAVAQPIYPVRLSDYLHVIPFTLPAGDHTFQVEGLSATHGVPCVDENGFTVECGSNSAIYGTKMGGFVCELYKNVTAQILSEIMDQDSLNGYYAKHSINGVQTAITTLLLQGSPTDTGVHGNYICSDYLDNSIEGAYYCVKTLTEPYGECCFKLINCLTGAVTITNTNLNQYLDKIIKVNEQSGCYIINIEDDEDCSGAIAVTIKDEFDTCELCNKVYYKLVDCTGNVASLYTDYNLASHVGKIIKISGYTVCWIVVIEGDADKDLITPVIVSSYDTCEECL